MRDPFYHVCQHWTESRGLDRGCVVLSELPRGDSPVTVRTRSIKYVIEGTERYDIDGRTHVVRAGEFLFVDAGVEARAVLPDPGVTRGLCIYFEPSETMPAMPLTEGDPDIPRVFHMSSSFMPFGRALQRAGIRLAREKALAPPAATELIRQTMVEFGGLESNLALELMRIDAAKPSTRRDILQRVYRARAYLHDHVDRVIPLGRLAAIAGMSQFHLARSFRAVFGLPPGQYHAELRIRLAEKALRSGRMSIAEAAQYFGFAEASSFSRAFVRVAGITPGDASRNRLAWAPRRNP